MSKLTLVPKSKQETAFINNVILNFKTLDTSNIVDVVKLEYVVNQLRSIIDQAWSKNAKKSKISKHSKSWWLGRMHAVGPSTITEQQEVMKTRRHSKRQLKTPSKPSLITKFKKSQIKAMAHGS